MAYLKLFREKLQSNYDYLDQTFKKKDIDWAIVTKLLCGNKLFLKEVLALGIDEVCDSRLSNLETIKEMQPDVQTVYIKPPPLELIDDIVRYADVSFNSESSIIEKLSEAAQKQNKTHKVTIMIELGDLREGIMGDSLLDFYKKVFELPNIEVVAIGANLNCLYGVMPTQDKLIQLSLYKQLIEATFEVEIPWISGGSSVTLPLLLQNQIPSNVNHFRIGETLFFGKNLFTGDTIAGLHDDVLKLYAQIIEVTEKPKVPIGEMAENPSGEVYDIPEEDIGKTSYRAIIDVGLLDCGPSFLIPDDPDIKLVNASSDMLVIDLGEANSGYSVGDIISFKLKYMGALSLLNSDYIRKEVT